MWVWCSSEAYGVATTSPRDSAGSVGQQTETASLFAVWRAGPSGQAVRQQTLVAPTHANHLDVPDQIFPIPPVASGLALASINPLPISASFRQSGGPVVGSGRQVWSVR
uniref:Uncharacterized protein n=1 Tax=Chromera velia CCMP2878 TaxID=1169474 RepID=A0A0K6S6J0_9ALVE|eukprot:Cvel_16418.t1-p1 / transcript=Cvel_16418.t1 / gene=Cvel_16418 / organism=Chromera_velia_CCMP2878 / gene_product=hypothetical protein / transcript_product=hypothetical protein / location=Cvel_scaffold1264:29064-29387(-) / protein_length=108 / sequence_SO=supercontig / SO=protein_coding / is_pseudo=false